MKLSIEEARLLNRLVQAEVFVVQREQRKARIPDAQEALGIELVALQSLGARILKEIREARK